MPPLRIGFVTGNPSRIRRRALAGKYRLMRARGLTYPDVYSIGYWLGSEVTFVADGELVRPGDYDLVISELNHSRPQLEYLGSLIGGGVRMAIVPGPPEFLASGMTQAKLELVRQILGGAAHVWAYAGSVRDFCDGLLGEPKSVVIPWPFDLEMTRRLAGDRAPRARGQPIRIVLGVPLRFVGIWANFPFVLKGVVTNVLAGMPEASRRRIRFHSFVYTRDDRRCFVESEFADGFPVRLERRRSFSRFVRFTADCDAVVNLTSESVLGRITFLAAALGKPAVFSDNSELNRQLYPAASVPLLDVQQLHERLSQLLEGLVAGGCSGELFPSGAALERIGNFEANGATMRALVRGP